VGARRSLRVIVVDDSPEFVRWVKRHLARIDGIELVGVFSCAEEALLGAACENPDVVLMDVSMPGCEGTEATRRLKRWERAPRVVLVSGDESEGRRRAAFATGADAFLGKTELTRGLPAALGLGTI
jgi:DNA-binding NarL/FixJ family response regulator